MMAGSESSHPATHSKGETVIRFLVVGLGNTAFGYSVYALAVLAGLPPQFALALQFVLGVLWNYTMHARLVFSVNGWGRFPFYLGAYVIIYLINALALRRLLDSGVGPLIAQLVILPFIVAISWFLIGGIMGAFSRRSVD